MPRADAALALGIFAGGFAGGVAAMVWIDPAILETESLHLTRLALLWIVGAVASLLVLRTP